MRPVRARRWAGLIALLALVLLTAACTGGPSSAPRPLPSTVSPSAGVQDPAKDPALARFYDQRPTWRSCRSDFVCAAVTVPVDWSVPAGPTIAIHMLKVAATGTALGSLLINPGGPGVSGMDYAQLAKQAFGDPVLANYDVVGFDPRGVGESAGVRCLPDAAMDDLFASDATPDSGAEVSVLEKQNARLAAGCQARNSADLLAHLDTLSVVHDMDVLRAALGDPVLNYYGASYGTYLGAWYAQTFPWRVGRMVLDGAIDPSLSTQAYARGQAAGFHLALSDYVASCVKDTSCPLRGTAEAGMTQLVALADKLDARPLRTRTGRVLTQSLMLYGLGMAAYDNRFWPRLTSALKGVETGDGTAMLALADAYLERKADGTYDPALQANQAIYCVDHAENQTVAQIAAQAQQLGQEYPPLGASIGWGELGCRGWPFPAVMPVQKVHAAGAAPILVVGSRYDPATPYTWARSLAAQLDSGTLLTYEGQGHTAYHRGSSCIDDAVEGYLVSGSPPQVRTCAAAGS